MHTPDGQSLSTTASPLSGAGLFSVLLMIIMTNLTLDLKAIEIEMLNIVETLGHSLQDTDGCPDGDDPVAVDRYRFLQSLHHDMCTH